jgi:hypothetical protein
MEMSENDPRRRSITVRRQTLALPVFPTEDRTHLLARQMSTSVNIQSRLLTVPQMRLPNGYEYRSQERVPPAGADCQRQFVSTRVEETDEPVNQRRLSIISEFYQPIEDEDTRTTNGINGAAAQTNADKRRRRILFIIEPIIVGLILLPIVVLFWECGWNLVWILLNTVNKHPSTLKFNKVKDKQLTEQSLHSLFIPYLIAQILLLILYLGQDFVYDFLKRQNYIITFVLLQCHILLLASIYIVQWEMLWTLWDQYTPQEWYFIFVLSLASLFALIVLIGHLSDLVCAPFLISYDSIECCLHFGCPLLTREVSSFLDKQNEFYLLLQDETMENQCD